MKNLPGASAAYVEGYSSGHTIAAIDKGFGGTKVMTEEAARNWALISKIPVEKQDDWINLKRTTKNTKGHESRRLIRFRVQRFRGQRS